MQIIIISIIATGALKPTKTVKNPIPALRALRPMMIIILLLMLTLWITACAGGTKKAMGRYRGWGNHNIIEVVGRVYIKRQKSNTKLYKMMVMVETIILIQIMMTFTMTIAMKMTKAMTLQRQ